MDTKFSAAIHTLILIDESKEPMTSEGIARSVGTNASYIRKIISLLKKKGIIESHRGIGGYALVPKAKELTLLQIYQAVYENDSICLFDIHQNSNDRCVVGRYIRPVLVELFTEMEEAAALALVGKTLADCTDAIRKRLDEKKEKDGRGKKIAGGGM